MNKVLLTTMAVALTLLTATAFYGVASSSSSTSSFLSKSPKVNTTTTAVNNVQGSYTYFAFEREWPGTVCKLNKCTAAYMGKFDSMNFNLHGLWPSGLADNVCSYPQDCGTSHYSASSLQTDLRAYMNMYWTGLYSNTNSFLDHEWTKHGTCFGNDQNEYFSIATSLHAQYNPITALAMNGIVPSDTVAYTVASIQNALESSFGGKVAMQCKFLNQQQYFFAFDMYFDRDLNGIIDQPCKKNTSCVATRPVLLPLVTY